METETKIINWDDGHRPGSTSQETKMAINLNKAADSFFLVFDNFLRNELCDLIYEYALRRGRPWGILYLLSVFISLRCIYYNT